MHVVIPPQVQDFTLALLEPHQVPPYPTLMPVHVSLNGSTAFRCIHQSSQLCIISKLAEGGLYPFIQVIDEDVEQDQTQYQSLGNTNRFRPLTRLTIDHNPMSFTSQPVLSSPQCPHIYPALSMLHYKYVVGDSVKCLAEVKIQNIHCSSLIYPASDGVIEGYQTGQADLVNPC